MQPAAVKLKNHLLERRSTSRNGRVTDCYMKAYLENLDCSPLLREARALKYLWEHIKLPIHHEELIVGSLIRSEPVAFTYGGGTGIYEERAREWILQEGLGPEEETAFRKELEKIQLKRHVDWKRDIFTDEEWASLESGAAGCTFFGGHMVLDYPYVLSRGLDGIGENIRQYAAAAEAGKSEFYEAMFSLLEGIRSIICRYAETAGRMVNISVSADADRLLAIQKNCIHIAARPPETFHQALQLVWFLHLLDDCDSYGRFDQYLYPYLESDLKKGAITIEQALELLEAFWVKIEEHGAIENMTIGGVDAEGKPAYNELTRLCLRATREMGFACPNLAMRVDPQMPQYLWEEIMENLATGQGLPALYNDKVIIRSLTESGIPDSVACDYCLAGCSQVMLPGISNYVNDIGMMNIAKCLEITYHNGVDPATGKQVGLQTGNAGSFADFDSFMDAFREQLRYFCKLEADINNKDTLFRREREGYAIRTLLVRDCLEKGMGVYHGGPRYNGMQMECIGITNAADSLLGIRKAVFEDRRVSFEELLAALQCNFQGYEPLRNYLRNEVPKFGNDIMEADLLRRDISAFIFNEVRKQKSITGGYFIPGEVIFTAHDWCGKAVGATPDGRPAGEVLADSCGAVQGMDLNGPTALLNSVLKIPTDGQFTCIVLNMKFLKSLWVQPGAQVKIGTLLRSFFARGGMQLQINVCDAEILKEAMKDPDKYRSLVVRVGGYSAYYTTLSAALQQEIIDRTAH
jgi:pyruvate formate-lyase/glycerol dehydratase family glycyl radical enzyme